MDLAKIDKQILKPIILEILAENPSLLKGIINEILIENKIIVSKEQETRRKKLQQLIEEDFARYDEVFKALA